MELYPFLLSYVIKTPIWGGNRLLRDWGKVSDSPTAGESWELTVRKQEKSVIRNGVYAGKTLEEVLTMSDTDLVGTGKGTGFPLLIKFLDARDTLSVQVHPDDIYAARVENDRGKTEMWYIVEADPGSELIVGLEPGLTSADLARAIADGEPERGLRHCPVKQGDVYFIPSGMLHAIGKGILIAEIQQNCDLTYRLYDFNRRQPDGSLRELHIKKALDVIRPYTEEEINAIRFKNAPDHANDPDLLAACDFFSVRRVDLKKGTYSAPAQPTMQHILVLSGTGEISCRQKSYPLAKGYSYFIPATLPITLSGNALLLLTRG